MSGLAESCVTAKERETPMGFTGDSGGLLTAVCVQASAKTEQVAASRIIELGTQVIVEDRGRS